MKLRPHLSLGGLADDQPELGFARWRPQTLRRSTHKAHPARALREAINTPPGLRCSHHGNRHRGESPHPSCQRPLQESRRPHPSQPQPQLVYNHPPHSCSPPVGSLHDRLHARARPQPCSPHPTLRTSCPHAIAIDRHASDMLRPFPLRHSSQRLHNVMWFVSNLQTLALLNQLVPVQ